MGESGTGKELFAHAIHQLSKRFYGPFVTVNCAAVPEALFESELFGYKEGSFTGAKKSGKLGKFALAHKGTIFLDEIGELSLSMQAKLLRVLQEKEIEPVGGLPESVDIRVIAATNRRLEQMVGEGSFRRDLYFRLHVVELRIPSLRERREDIPPLCEALLADIEHWTSESGMDKVGIEPEAMKLLQSYDWPGNVRELSNVLERALYMMEGRMIKTNDLIDSLKQPGAGQQGQMAQVAANFDYVRGSLQTGTLKEAVEQLEQQYIKQALEEANGDKRLAAQRLGLSKSVLYTKLDKAKKQN
jgi:transcriptional regulator with PAS, ATPase and Fis domain